MRYLQIPFPRFSTSVSLALVATAALLLASAGGCSAAVAPDDNQSETPETPGRSDPGKPPKPDPATVSVAPATVDEGRHAAFAVTLSRTLPNPVTVHWKTEDGTAMAGTDSTGDFTGESGGTVVFEAGTTRQTILVATVQDEMHEDDETFEVVLTGVTPPDAALLGQARATCTITDDDPPPADDHGDTPETASTVAPGTPVSGRLETAADVDFFKISVPGERLLFAATDPNPSRVGDSGYDADTVVRIAGATRDNSDNVASGVVSSGMAYVRVSGASATHYDLAVWLLEPTESDTSFDIEFRYLGTQPTTAQKSIFRAAADVWEEVVTGDLGRRIITDSELECEDGDPSTFGDAVDDLRIDIRLREIDGPTKTLAIAGPCAVRTGGLPLIGEVTIDTADLTRIGTEGLRRTVVHEIAHVLGYGTSDQWLGLLRNSAVEYEKNNPDAEELPDTHFVGTAAVSAFDELLAGATYSGARVPVENDTEEYGIGGLDGHWREAVFGDELLTATISADPQVSQPLSKVTIASLADLGYRVDYTKADSYSLPSTSRSLLRAQSAQDEFNLGDHIRRGPVIMVDVPE
ncbi:MAG: hypothetical protein OXH96_23815 [Spirochaetaceae bacterium]|nr:hypothetical protein [Spirochaetaceae bacterium]